MNDVASPCFRCRAPTIRQPCSACQQLELNREQVYLLGEQNRLLKKPVLDESFDETVERFTPWVVISIGALFALAAFAFLGFDTPIKRTFVIIAAVCGCLICFRFRWLLVLIFQIMTAIVVFGALLCVIAFVIWWLIFH